MKKGLLLHFLRKKEQCLKFGRQKLSLDHIDASSHLLNALCFTLGATTMKAETWSPPLCVRRSDILLNRTKEGELKKTLKNIHFKEELSSSKRFKRKEVLWWKRLGGVDRQRVDGRRLWRPVPALLDALSRTASSAGCSCSPARQTSPESDERSKK